MKLNNLRLKTTLDSNIDIPMPKYASVYQAVTKVLEFPLHRLQSVVIDPATDRSCLLATLSNDPLAHMGCLTQRLTLPFS